MQTRALTRDEWERRAVPARKRVFARLRPFGTRFGDTLPRRALIFPISYSPPFTTSTSWGMAVSDGGQTVVAGSPGFMPVIASRFPAMEPEPSTHSALMGSEAPRGRPLGDEQVLAFLESRKALRATSAWAPGLVAHFFGEEHAERLRRDAGW